MRTTNPNFTNTILGIESKNEIITLFTIYDPNNPLQVIARLADGIGIDKSSSATDERKWKPLRLTGSISIGTSITTDEISYETFTTTDDDIIYGVISRGESFLYLPMQIILPDEVDGRNPRATITFFNITGHLIPLVRTLNLPPPITIELILSDNPDEVEISFSDLYMFNISYNKDTVTAEISLPGLDREPFPQHSFTPFYFPGLF
jgi:hypothetical protein